MVDGESLVAATGFNDSKSGQKLEWIAPILRIWLTDLLLVAYARDAYATLLAG